MMSINMKKIEKALVEVSVELNVVQRVVQRTVLHRQIWIKTFDFDAAGLTSF